MKKRRKRGKRIRELHKKEERKRKKTNLIVTDLIFLPFVRREDNREEKEANKTTI